MNKNKLHIAMQMVIENKEQNFEIFYKECKDYAFKIAFGIIKNKEDSEDIVQNLFLKLYKLPVNKFPTKSEASWLYAVAKNETLNYIKSKRKDINIDELQIYKDDVEISNLINESSYNELMRKLNSEEELIVKLKTESNFTFKEIAKLLGKNENTVKWKYYSAIHTLKLFITNLCLFVICTSIVNLMDKNVHEEQQSNDGINGKDDENTINEEQNSSQENQELDSAIENGTNTENSSQKNEMDWPDSFIENEFDTTITDSIITEDSNAINDNNINENKINESNINDDNINDNNINESLNTEDLKETAQTIENDTFNTTTKLPLYFLSILFLVLTIIFLIKFIKYQLKRKNKLSKK